jgi:hypothetical protein
VRTNYKASPGEKQARQHKLYDFDTITFCVMKTETPTRTAQVLSPAKSGPTENFWLDYGQSGEGFQPFTTSVAEFLSMVKAHPIFGLAVLFSEYKNGDAYQKYVLLQKKDKVQVLDMEGEQVTVIDNIPLNSTTWDLYRKLRFLANNKQVAALFLTLF